MPRKTPEAMLRAICLRLPEVEEKPFGGHTTPAYRVRDKLFVMQSDDDGRQRMMCKGAPGAQQVLVGSEPDRYFVPRYTGHNGWIGVWLDDRTDWDVVADLVEESYRMTAPKRVAALMTPRPS